jgi:hypothetical protein
VYVKQEDTSREQEKSEHVEVGRRRFASRRTTETPITNMPFVQALSPSKKNAYVTNKQQR